MPADFPLRRTSIDGGRRTGLELGDALGTFRALAAFGVVLVVAFREEQLVYEGSKSAPTSRGTPLSVGVSAAPTSAARGPT